MVILIYTTTQQQQQHKPPLTQTMYLWVAHVDPVEYLVRVCTLAPAQLVRGRHSGHGYQRLEQNAHTVVDGVRGTHCRVAAVHTQSQGPRLQHHRVPLVGAQRDLDAQREALHDRVTGHEIQGTLRVFHYFGIVIDGDVELEGGEEVGLEM